MDENVPQDRNRHPCIGVTDSDTGETRILKSIDFSGLPLIPVAVHVYDTDLTSWIKGQQAVVEAASDLTVSMGDVEALLAKYYWKSIQYDYDTSGNCIYVGRNTSLSAADGDNTWYVTRFYWTAGRCTQQKVRITNWTNRAAGW